MLFKLSLKNLKKSVKDYAIYFFTLILGVAIFYVFNAIDSQTVMLEVSQGTRDLIDLLNSMLSGVSIMVSFILGFLIIYASRFLMKRRKKEFGIYLTLGMSKRKISMILFLETLFIGIISFIVGIGAGILISQFMSILVANLFEANMSEFTFVFSQSALIKTGFYFGIIYLLVMIFNTVQVSRCKLINLINANKKTEKVKMKNPILCIIIFILSLVLLIYAYYKVSFGYDTIQSTAEIYQIILIGILATFLFFFSISGLLLKVFHSLKKVYYKGLNCFTFRQISSKVNTTVVSMGMICLMLFVTICVFSSCLSMKNAMSANLTELAKVDIEFTKLRNLTEQERDDYGFSEELRQDSYQSIEESLKKINFDPEKYLKDETLVYYYTDDEVTISKSLGNIYEEVKDTYTALDYTSREIIMSESDYNKVARLYGNKTYDLNEGEYMVVADFDSMVEVRNRALEQNNPITLNGKTYYPKYDHCEEGFVDMSNSHINTGIIIVNDDAVNDSMIESEILLANYKANTQEEKEKIESLLQTQEGNTNILLSANSKLAIYEASVGLGAVVTFIGLYIGIIFLISSAAILALKELSESTDNVERFSILRKIGADEKQINGALFKQIAIFFLLPLSLAIVHSIFGIMFCQKVLETFGKEQLMASVTMTAIFLIFIYGGYFLITYFCSKNIIKEKR